MTRSNRRRQSRHQRSEQQSSTQSRWSIITSTLLLLLLAVPASAQQWHYVYGDDNSNQDGKRNVAPVNGLCTGSAYGGVLGYISVGTDDSRLGINDVYVVRTNNNGTAAWERTYDIGFDNLDDYGESILELADGSGFVVTGSTITANGDRDVFIMKIDCQGNHVWTNTYGAVGLDEGAFDIIETTSGNANQLPIPTSPGDLVICGDAFSIVGGVGSWDALIMRTTSNGTLIWDQLYDIPNIDPFTNNNEHLLGLIEATQFNGAATGDIVAVGAVEDIAPDRQEGLVIRVSGDDGTLGNTAVQNIARFGATALADFCPTPTTPFTNTGDEVFEAVIELQNPAETDAFGVPNIVMVGSSTARSNSDVYAVKIHGGDPCDPAPVEMIISDPTYTIPTVCDPDDGAYDVKEVNWEMTSDEVSQWDLAITGYSDTRNPNLAGNGNDDHDVILLTIDPSTLAPVVGGISMWYGREADTTQHEIGHSLYPVRGLSGRTEGFIICGVNLSDPLGVGDPLDHYLIKTDNTGSASSSGYCEDPEGWEEFIPSGAVCESATTLSRLTDTERSTRVRSRDKDDEICLVGPKRTVRHDGTATSASGALTFLHRCNTFTGDASITLQQIKDAVGLLRLRVVNAAGHVIVDREFDAGSSSVSFELNGAESGVYLIALSDDVATATTRISILR